MNKVILMGNLGKDPEVRALESGAKVANFTLATNETYTNKQGERVTQTEWHNLEVWNKQAEVAEKYLKKGSQILVEGSIRTRSYTDKDGNTRYITEIRVANFKMLGAPAGGGNDMGAPAPHAQPAASSAAPSQDFSESADDDLPF